MKMLIMSVAPSAGAEVSYRETQLSVETPSHTKQIISPSAGALILLLTSAAGPHGLPTVGSHLTSRAVEHPGPEQPDRSVF